MNFALEWAFEVAIAQLVKSDQDRHNLAVTQSAFSLSLHRSTTQQMLLPLQFKLLADIIDVTKYGF
ncbi:hypothetical protein DO97_02805 [Neosynechococcus sphagnicola sy1]|uniref:Uncharacterized protein n=1 Tax=Neosynechococcus sphagnicola sy1 TaxID=1497020 RepID=A0A098TQ95_9CYAN|nr:hypothetical protein DO97_02805 [Neosynechococcus sphagnicola sy1]